MLTNFDLPKFIGEFNASEESVKILAIVSPTCPDCLLGFRVIKKLFARFDSKKLKGFIVWISMLKEDGEHAAQIQSDTFEDSRVSQFWSYDRNVGRMFAGTLHLQSGLAWDVYLLYSPRVKWEIDEPPAPVFWMHQLTSDPSANQEIRLNPERFEEEVKFLLESEDPDLTEREVSQVLLDKKKAS